MAYQTQQSKNKPTHFSKENYAYLKGEVVSYRKRETSQFAQLIIHVQAGYYDKKKKNCSGKLLVYVDTQRLIPLAVGTVIMLPNQYERIENEHNPGEFDAVNYWGNQHIYHISFLKGTEIKRTSTKALMHNWLGRVQHQLSKQLETVLRGTELAVAKAILLGERSDISSDITDAFSGTGAMHLLSVSGLHIGIFVWMIEQLLLFFYPSIRKKIAFILLLAVMWLYAGISGFSPSVNRAALMFSFLLFAQLSGRNYQPIRILLISAFLLLLYDANYLFDIGFQLSYAAMLGIFLFYQRINTWVSIKQNWLRKCWETTAVGIAAQITTLPFTLYYFHQFPNYFVFTNIGLMLFSGVIMALGLTYFCVCWIPILGKWVGVLLYYSLHYLMSFIQWVYELPYSVATGIPFSLWELVAFFIALIFIAYALYAKRYRVLAFLLPLAFICWINLHYLQQNYFSKQLWVLNERQPVVFFKSKGSAVLFIFSPNMKKEKIDYMKKSLTTYFGKEIRVCLVRKKHTKISWIEQQLNCVYDNNGIWLERKHSVFVLNNNRISAQQRKAPLLLLSARVPFFLAEELQEERAKIGLTTHRLANGAWRITE